MMETIGDLAALVADVRPADLGDDATPLEQADWADHSAMAGTIYRLFTEGDGPAVLDWLCSLTVRRPTIDFELMQSGASNDALMRLAFFREGENEVVRRILLTIQQIDSAARGESDAESAD